MKYLAPLIVMALIAWSVDWELLYCGRYTCVLPTKMGKVGECLRANVWGRYYWGECPQASPSPKVESP